MPEIKDANQTESKNMDSAVKIPEGKTAKHNIKIGYLAVSAVIIVIVAVSVLFFQGGGTSTSTTVSTSSVLTSTMTVPTTTVSVAPETNNFTLRQKITMNATLLPPNAISGYYFIYNSSLYSMIIKTATYPSQSDMLAAYNSAVNFQQNKSIAAFFNLPVNTSGGEIALPGVTTTDTYILNSHFNKTLVAITLISTVSSNIPQSSVASAALSALKSTSLWLA
jgi:hypothetical protein